MKFVQPTWEIGNGLLWEGTQDNNWDKGRYSDNNSDSDIDSDKNSVPVWCFMPDGWKVFNKKIRD